MKQSQAWRILAKEYAAGNTERFLCWALATEPVLADSLNPAVARIPLRTRKAMVQRIQLDVGSVGPAYKQLPFETEGRVLACLMFAEEAASKERKRAK